MILFKRDSAGIFEPRRRAAQALAALKATDVLKEFVAGWLRATDPVEGFGDEAVLGAASRALGASLDENVLLPGERTIPLQENASHVSFCVRGSADCHVGSRTLSFETFDTWNIP